MARSLRTVLLVLGVGLLTTLASGTVAAPASHPGVVPSPPIRSSAAPRVSTDYRPSDPSAATAPSGNLGSRLATIRSDLARDGAPMRDVHFPNLGAERPRGAQPVSPVYGAAPAPMGVADIGLRDVAGSLAGYYLNTSSAEGTVNFSSAEAVYLDGDGPDMFGVQLNSVLTNVTLFGNSSYQFWTQNFVSYTSSSGQLAFGDNIWNFSSPSGNISSNAIYAHGPNGTLLAPVLYLAVGPSITVHYPFSLTFYLNATTLEDRPALFFNYTVANSTWSTSGSYDYVIFNSSAATPVLPAPAAQFQIDGESYDPIGLLNDVELSLLGNDNGDTTTFTELNATATIATWNSTSNRYDPVPSAVNSGSDTGETSEGVASYYTGDSPVAHLALGPSFLQGLWNSTNPAGERTVEAKVNPAPAILMINPGSYRRASEAQWVPLSPSGTTNISLPNTGKYYLEFELSEYDSTDRTIPNGNSNATTPLSVNLTFDPSAGIYTPMIAWGNSELAVFAASGNGTASNPYVLYDNEASNLNSEFAMWNDFQFPVFPGLLLIGTSAYVQITPPPFSISFPPYILNATMNGVYTSGLPTSNNLQLEFWNVSHVTLLNAAHIAGWLSANLFSFYPLAATIFWNSTDNLIASNTFADQGISLALYGGTNNTIWGNEFLTTGVSAPDPTHVLEYPSNETGLWESESGDLVYNNYFSVAIPAYTPRFDPLSCQVACTSAEYLDRWNISEEPAAEVRTVLGVPLNGSVLGTASQGGNFWSNYGTPPDPYGALPYNDTGWIAEGGDYAPLVPDRLYTITFDESGLPAGSAWGINTSLVRVNTTHASFTIEAPNGTYAYSTLGPSGYVTTPAPSFAVQGSNVTVDVPFSVPSAPSSGAGNDATGIIASLAILAAVLAVVLVVVLRRRPPPPPVAPEAWKELPDEPGAPGAGQARATGPSTDSAPPPPEATPPSP
jgi:thermopsin